MAIPPSSPPHQPTYAVPSSAPPRRSSPIASFLDSLPLSARSYLPSFLVGSHPTGASTSNSNGAAHSSPHAHSASYEPLLGQEATGSAARLHDEEDDTDDDEDEDEEAPMNSARGASGIEGMESMTVTHRWAIWVAFGLFGSAVLLPFNALITPSEYYRSLFSRTPFKDSFMSWIVITYNAATIAFSAHAMSSMSRTTPARRIFTAKPAMLLALLGLTLLTSTSNVSSPSSSSIPFLALLALTFGLAAAGAYLQTAVVALASSFGARSMGSMLAGQGLVGLVLSLIQLSAAWARANEGYVASKSDTAATSSMVAEANGKAAKAAAVTLYLCSTAVMLLSLVVFALLRTSSAYRTLVPSSSSSSSKLGTSTTRPQPQTPSPLSISSRDRIRAAQAPILGLCIALAAIFTVTLSLFPSLTARIRSTHLPSSIVSNDQPSRQQQPPSWRDPLLFVSLHFVLFNLSDLIGRLLPSLLPSLCIFTSKMTLYVLSASRFLFLPLFAMCNVAPSSGVASTSTSQSPGLGDAAFLLILLAFGSSNGLLSTNIFIKGPSSPELTDAQRPLAAAILSFWLSLGLAAGSAASFLVAALV